MKNVLVVIGLMFMSLSFHAQNTMADINFGETLQYNNIELEFVKVISDSRCPKGVMCIRAGEAIILVALYMDGKFIKEQKLIFYASGVIKEKQNLLLSTKEIRISGLALYPYPKSPGSILDRDYFLKVQIN